MIISFTEEAKQYLEIKEGKWVVKEGTPTKIKKKLEFILYFYMLKE